MGDLGEKSWVKEHYRIGDAEIISNRLNAINQFHPGHVLDASSILDFISNIDMTQIVWGLLAAAHGRRTHYPFNSPSLIKAAFNTSWEEKLPNWPPKRLGRLVAEKLGVLSPAR